MIKIRMEVNKKVGAVAQKNEAADGLVARLAADYPELRFKVGKKFMFRPPRTVVMEWHSERSGGAEMGGSGANNGVEIEDCKANAEVCGANEWGLQLLHEVGHATLGHRDFRTDAERLRMEREAWERARELCATYNIWYDEEFVEAELDTYRDWLHQRSRCSECGLTRYQTVDGRWHCPGCEM